MQLLQASAILMARAEADDANDGKIINQYKPALGLQDGINKVFAIPVQRVIVVNLQIYQNNVLLTLGTDYSFINTKLGQFQFAIAPKVTDDLYYNVGYTWADDIEFDHYLNRAANELGYGIYHTDYPGTVAGAETPVDSSGNPVTITDFPAGLLSALIYGGAYKLCQALANRFALKYDISAGDKSYSPSQMAARYDEIATRLNKQFLNARDDFYKGQGHQYRPSIAVGSMGSVGQGFVLPNVTPQR